MDPFDLFLQNAATAAEEVPSGVASVRSRSPNPFLMEDSAEDVIPQLHSSNPFAMQDETDSVIFDLSSIPNPFAEFHATAKSLQRSSDLFDLEFEEQQLPPKPEMIKSRKTSNPFIYEDDDDTVVDGNVEKVVNKDPFSIQLPAVGSSSSGKTFDPFGSSLAKTEDQFGAEDKYASGWLTPPDDFGNSAIEINKPVVDVPVCKAPPRPPPPSKTAPPARPPPPAVSSTVKVTPPSNTDTWDIFSSGPSKPPIPPPPQVSESQNLLDDFFGVPEAAPSAAVANSFDILLQEDKVEFEPISVNINITEPTPTPKRNDINSFFDDRDDLESDDWSTVRTTETPKILPRPPSNDANLTLDEAPVKPEVVMMVTQASIVDSFDFEQKLSTEDVHQEAVILEAEAEKEPDKVVIDTSAFEEFEAKFSTMLAGQSQMELDTTSTSYDPFSDLSSGGLNENVVQGFGPSDDFDQLFGMKEIPAAPKPSPAHFDLTSKPQTNAPAIKPPADSADSPDSDDSGPDFSVFIRPKMRDAPQGNIDSQSMIVPILAPPPAKSPQPRSPTTQSRFNPFDKSGQISNQINLSEEVDEFLAIFETPVSSSTLEKPQTIAELSSVGSPEATKPMAGNEANAEVESLGSPVFEADDTEPLEDFYPKHDGHGWEMMLRQPSKKKLTGQRYWKKVYLTLSDNSVLHLYGKSDDKDAFQELPLQACYSLSELATQQYDQYGKIFTVKLQYVFYRERMGVRPGQINKVTQGQITSLGQLAKLGLPLEHAPQVSQLLKLGSLNYEELKEFVRVVEDSLFHLTVHRDRALTYKTEEIQVTVVDELRAEVANNGVVLLQVARVRVFFLAFIGNMPDVEIGLNDITKQGKEVVGRHDIIPVVTEEWIRLEKCEFHSCVVVDAFEKNRTLKLHPPDACFFELMRFRIRPPKNRELPLQVRTKMTIIGNRVEIRADVIVPGSISRKHGQIPCEDVAIRFPLPECWIYLFRTEKHFRYGSVKSTSRRPGKLKGLDRFMGTGSTLEPSLIEVSTGQAKYEHQHRAIVWRVPKLPKEGQGAYSTYLFVCRMELSSYDQIPEEFDSTVNVEFYMPTTTVSHTTVRSVSVTNPNPPEKYVKYLARHCYRVGIEHVNVAAESEYLAATAGAGTATNASANSRSTACSREPSEDTDGSVPSN